MVIRIRALMETWIRTTRKMKIQITKIRTMKIKIMKKEIRNQDLIWVVRQRAMPDVDTMEQALVLIIATRLAPINAVTIQAIRLTQSKSPLQLAHRQHRLLHQLLL